MTKHVEDPLTPVGQDSPEPRGMSVWTPLLWMAIPLLIVILQELLRPVE